MQPGSPVPSVIVYDDDVQPVDIADLAADGPFLLSFYLYDWTGTWRTQLRLLRDRSEEFTEAGVRLFAISRDSPYSHKRYAEQQWLTYPLLSDWSAAAVRAFGVSQNLDGLEDTPVRSCFLVDGDGVVRKTWRYGDDEVPDADELLHAAHEL